jgi:hypothetical protein
MGLLRKAKGVVRKLKRAFRVPFRRFGRAFFVMFRSGAVSVCRQFVLFSSFPVCLMHGKTLLLSGVHVIMCTRMPTVMSLAFSTAIHPPEHS